MVPPEIWAQILAYIPTNQLPKIRQLSKYFQQLASDNLKQRIKNNQIVLRVSHEPRLVDIGPYGDSDFVQPSDVVAYDCSRFKIVEDTVMILATPPIQKVLEYFTPKFDEGYSTLFMQAILHPDEYVEYDLANDVLHGQGPRHFHDNWCALAEFAIVDDGDERFERFKRLIFIYDTIATDISADIFQDESFLDYWDGSDVWKNSTSKISNNTALRLLDAKEHNLLSVLPPQLQQTLTQVDRRSIIAVNKSVVDDYCAETVWRVWKDGVSGTAVNECLAIRLRVPLWTAIRLLC